MSRLPAVREGSEPGGVEVGDIVVLIFLVANWDTGSVVFRELAPGEVGGEGVGGVQVLTHGGVLPQYVDINESLTAVWCWAGLSADRGV